MLTFFLSVSLSPCSVPPPCSGHHSSCFVLFPFSLLSSHFQLPLTPPGPHRCHHHRLIPLTRLGPAPPPDGYDPLRPCSPGFCSGSSCAARPPSARSLPVQRCPHSTGWAREGKARNGAESEGATALPELATWYHRTSCSAHRPGLAVLVHYERLVWHWQLHSPGKKNYDFGLHSCDYTFVIWFTPVF